MKTYVIIVSSTFPLTHPSAGEPTNFPGMILNKQKKHTIRGNYDFWKKRIDEVNEGKAYLSVRTWEGKPYRSKQLEIARFYKEHGIGVEKLSLLNGRLMFPCVLLEHQRSLLISASDLAHNDALSLKNFVEWFKDYNLSQPMAIIQFTGFRYCG